MVSVQADADMLLALRMIPAACRTPTRGGEYIVWFCVCLSGGGGGRRFTVNGVLLVGGGGAVDDNDKRVKNG